MIAFSIQINGELTTINDPGNKDFTPVNVLFYNNRHD